MSTTPGRMLLAGQILPSYTKRSLWIKKCSETKPRGTETNTKTLQSNNPTQARANMRQRSHPDRRHLCNLRNGILHPPSCICPLPQRVMNCAFSWPLITRQPPADRHHTSVISNRHAFSPILAGGMREKDGYLHNSSGMGERILACLGRRHAKQESDKSIILANTGLEWR